MLREGEGMLRADPLFLVGRQVHDDDDLLQGGINATHLVVSRPVHLCTDLRLVRVPARRNCLQLNSEYRVVVVRHLVRQVEVDSVVDAGRTDVAARGCSDRSDDRLLEELHEIGLPSRHAPMQCAADGGDSGRSEY